VAENRVTVQRLLAMNIEAEKPKMVPDAIAEMVLSSSPDDALSAISNPAKPHRPARLKLL
jgi:hypothetical protein